ncbi:MAG TPA: phage antirepressor KilAC domain-containing protein [Fibrobacteria bacterium]|nr:phage antirepressor KilAC domain-containing protein [Geothrix sp.]HLP41228.1 phage antirepressor KilAC domain-containing protein [Fibrobacteria bacterium]
MNNEIPIIPFHGQEGIQAVSAKTLYRELYDTDQFSRWAETNILSNPHGKRGEDWVVSDIASETPQGGRPSQDYILRIDFAKKLAMMARSARGEQVRQYFLKCEEMAQAPAPVRDWIAMSDEDKALAYFSERKARKAIEVARAEEAPLVAYAAKVQASPTSFTVDTTAKELGLPVVKFREFVQAKYLFRRGRDWLPRAEYAGRGWFEVRTRTYDHNGVEITYHTTTVTGEGRIRLKDAWDRGHAVAEVA